MKLSLNNVIELRRKIFIQACEVCGKLGKSGKEGGLWICRECLPDDGMSHAICQCGATFEMEDNNVSCIHPGIKSQYVDPKKHCLFLINICPSCDSEKKLKDAGMFFYTII